MSFAVVLPGASETASWSAVATGDLWALDHASGTGGTPAWHPVICEGNPPTLMSPAGAIDFAADTWTFVGGKDKAGQHSRTVWRIVGLLRNTARCRWERVTFAEPGPVGRSHSSAALLSGSRGMVMVGGEFGNTSLADVWVLRGVERRLKKKRGAACDAPLATSFERESRSAN